MAEPTVVITGANSYLGESVVSHLLDGGGYSICAVVSPRWRPQHAPRGDARLKLISANLLDPLSEELKLQIQGAYRVVHLAWHRDPRLEQASEANDSMVLALMEELGAAQRFCLLSSVAASPGARSVYGQSKHRTMELVHRRGGSSLVCGLVVDARPKGPYELLSKVVRETPVNLRFVGRAPMVYPVHLGDVLKGVRCFLEHDLEPGRYRLFSEPVGLDRFLELLEERHRRSRLPLPVHVGAVVATVGALRKAGVAPSSLSDKLLTFLHKDAAYLSTHRALPQVHFRSLEEALDA